MIQETQHESIAADMLKHFAFSKEVSDELGESLVHHPRMKYLMWLEDKKVVSFLGYVENGRKCFLRFAYTDKNHRNQGYFTKLLEEMEDNTVCGIVSATSTSLALPHYLKRGYEVTKQYKNYAKIKKSL